MLRNKKNVFERFCKLENGNYYNSDRNTQLMQIEPEVIPSILKNDEINDEEKSIQIRSFTRVTHYSDRDLNNIPYTKLNGNTPFIEMAARGLIKCMNFFINNNIVNDVDQTNFMDRTALMEAACNGHLQCVNLLLSNNHEKKPRINLTDEHGDSALMIAIGRGKSACAEALLKAKPNLEIQDTDNKTALDIAIERSNFKIANLLLSQGAKLRTPELLLKNIMEEKKPQGNDVYCCLKAICETQEILRKTQSKTGILSDENYEQARKYLQSLPKPYWDQLRSLFGCPSAKLTSEKNLPNSVPSYSNKR